MERTVLLSQQSPVNFNSEKKQSSELSFQYYYNNKKENKAFSSMDNFKFVLFGHLIYATGLICGFIGFFIGIFKKVLRAF
jgi:hypothetical protein